MLKRSRLFFPLLALATPFACAATTAKPVDPRIEQLLNQLGKVQTIHAVAMSPDGRQLAWVVERKGRAAIELADADGSHVHALDAATAPGQCSESGIAWAPDSRHLAFISNCSNDLTSTKVMHNDIYLADTRAAQGTPRRLAQLTGYARALQWTANGKSLGYVPGATRHASALAAAKPASGEIGASGIEVQHVADLDVPSGNCNC